MIPFNLLQFYPAFGSGGIGGLLSNLQQQGFFRYALPFLLIFSLVLGILTKIELFRGNKAVNPILSLVVALMALQSDLVSNFFSEIFPKLGVVLSILLVFLVLGGLFFKFDEKSPIRGVVTWILFGLGVFIVLSSLNVINFNYSFGGSWLQDNFGFILLLVIIAFVIASSGSKKKEKILKISNGSF